MKSAFKTDAGLIRDLNEDAVLINDDIKLYVLSDGMGGHNAGEVASALANEVMESSLQGLEPSSPALTAAVQAANTAVYQKQLNNEALSGMGTTMTALWEGAEHVYVAQVGDSRAYLLRTGKLMRMTEDQSLVGDLIRSGALTPEQAKTHPYRHVITQAVGTEEEVTPAVQKVLKCQGDVWLLCSDGLNDMIDDDEIADIMRENRGEECAEKLITMALEAGGRDNVSVLILEVNA